MPKLSETMLARMDRWRHLPKYQLERRADLFFAMWLPQVLERFTGKEVDPRLIPEFPLKKALVDEAALGMETLNIDYLAFSSDREIAWMIELKTDMNSRSDKQDIAMKKACTLGWERILSGVCSVMGEPGKRDRDRKYRHLSHLLAELGLLSVPTDLDDYIFAEKSRRGLTQSLKAIRPTNLRPTLKCVYVQPRGDRQNGVISFDFFAQELERIGDKEALLFARYLQRWIEPAGSTKPG